MAEAWSLAWLEGGYIGTPFFTDRMLGWISYPVAATPRWGSQSGAAGITEGRIGTIGFVHNPDNASMT
jgi:hypothetical protein